MAKPLWRTQQASQFLVTRRRRDWWRAGVFLLIGFLQFFPTFGGELPRVSLSQYVNHRWDARDGLPQNAALTITQTENGFLWVGTQEGLALFDGFGFQVFDKSNTPVLASNEVTCLVADGRGGLWIGLNHGGIVYWLDGTFSQPIQDERLQRATIRSLLPGDTGQLYIGTESSGLFLLKAQGVERLAGPFGGKGISGLAKWGDHGLLVGTLGEGLLRYEDGIFQEISLGSHNHAKFINAVKEAPGKGYLVATDGAGLYLVHEFGVRQLSFFPNQPDLNHISSVSVDGKGQIWWGTEQGISRMDGEEINHFFVGDHDRPHRIHALIHDRDDNLWVGIRGVGLHQYSRGSFTPLASSEGLFDETVWMVTQAPSGELWVGTDNGGIYKIADGKPNQEGIPEELQKGLINGVAFANQGRIWVGGMGGLYLLENGQAEKIGGEMEAYKGAIFPIFCDRQDRLWFGSSAGFFVREGDQTTGFKHDALIPESIQAISQDDKDHIWLGGSEGLIRIKGKEIHVFLPMDDSLETQQIIAIHPDGDGLWISHETQGLGWFENGVFQFFKNAGLLPESPYAILSDNAGYLWYSSNVGVIRVAKTQLRGWLAGLTDQIQWTRFGVANGMLSAECNLGGAPSASKDDQGRLWFTTVRGLVMVDPSRVIEKRAPPKVYFSEVVVDGKPWPMQGEVVLPSQFQSLDIYFGAIEYFDSPSIRFRTKLSGLTTQWQPESTIRSAHFTQLPSGKMTFSVAAGNSFRGFDTAELIFRVPLTQRALWQQRAFVVLVLLGLLPLALLVWKWMSSHRHYQDLQVTLGELQAYETKKRGLLDSTATRMEQAHAAADRAVLATHLLHNVGNVLNSVSVSSGMMEKMLRSSDIQGLLRKIVGLLEGHRGELPHYLSADKQGRRVPSALADIAEIMEEGKEALFNELANLQLQCGHIKEIVKSLETSGKGLEPCRLPLLLEDALKLQGYLINKYRIQVVWEIDEDLLVLSQPSQLLQILVNLIKNAIEAMALLEEGRDRRIILRAKTHPGRSVILDIIDNGIGIEEAHLDRLFTRGFTTKKYGHGLGLSYCKTMMNQMKGDISVSNFGTSGSVTFRLSFLGMST